MAVGRYQEAILRRLALFFLFSLPALAQVRGLSSIDTAAVVEHSFPWQLLILFSLVPLFTCAYFFLSFKKPRTRSKQSPDNIIHLNDYRSSKEKEFKKAS